MQIRNWVATIALAIGPTVAGAQRAEFHGSGSGSHPPLHINPKWTQCSFQLDPSLTQAAWRQFTREAALVTYFRPVADARPMGAGNWELSLLQWDTGIDDSDEAWNNTFVHPDAEHWLFEGNGLKFPGLAARAGLTDRTDAGIYFTKSPGANYGFFGGQLQQNLVNDAARNWAASARLSFSSLYGPADLDFSVYGADLVASRTYALFSNRLVLSPYAGVSAMLSRSHEKTEVVNLNDENVIGTQGTVGVTTQIFGARVGAEYNVAAVRSVSIKVGFGTR